MWKSFFCHCRTFADGFPNLFVPNAHGIRSQHVAFLASFSSPGVIFEQLSIIYALPRMFVSSFTLVLPFFPTGTLERMEDEGDIATAFTLARILSNIPISRGGPTSLVIFDIHALQVSLYLLACHSFWASTTIFCMFSIYVTDHLLLGFVHLSLCALLSLRYWMVSGKVLLWWQCAAMLWEWHPLAQTSSASAPRCQQCEFIFIVRFQYSTKFLAVL